MSVSGSPPASGGEEPEGDYRPLGDGSAHERERRLAMAARVLAAAEGRASASPTDGSETYGSETYGSEARPRAAPRDVAPRTAGTREHPGDDRRGHGRTALPPPLDPDEEDGEPDPESVARAIVLRQLSMAPRSRQQLADKLRQRGCADDVSARVLDRMESVGLVDDEAYAEMLVRSKQATKGLAKRALAQELRGKGVADETISEALGSIDPESERGMAEEVAAKTMRRLGGLDPQVQARRLAGVLGRKGYPPSVVYAVVRDAVNEAPEHRRD